MIALFGHPSDAARVRWAASKMGPMWWVLDLDMPPGTVEFHEVSARRPKTPGARLGMGFTTGQRRCATTTRTAARDEALRRYWLDK